MDDAIGRIEKELENTARKCLRLIVTRTLKPKEYAALSKWVFGCMNQRFTIRRRVKERGKAELAKVLLFIEAACRELLVIGEREQDD